MTGRPVHYILTDHHIAIPCDLMTWARMIEKSTNRIVKQTQVGPALVSTVFLGLDHSFSMDPDAQPVLFETMIFGLDDEDGGWMTRYCTWEEAERGHETTVKATQEIVNRAKSQLATETSGKF